jgi:hypothetical protein
MVTLSQRAQDFLASLRRDDPVPVEQVVKLLAEQGIDPIPAWIEFHERYAGYWEDIGSDDFAVWGLAHKQVQGVASTPNSVYVDKTTDGRPVTIMCADVHPSWDYLLTPKGEFIGPPFRCETFDVKVERNALMWEFTHAGPVERIWDIDGVRVEDCRDKLVAEVEGFLVPEASDKFARYYYSPDKLMLESLRNAAIKLVVRKK